jgi:hypothetical protein
VRVGPPQNRYAPPIGSTRGRSPPDRRVAHEWSEPHPKRSTNRATLISRPRSSPLGPLPRLVHIRALAAFVAAALAEYGAQCGANRAVFEGVDAIP